MQMKTFEGKVVVVTGASSGLGEAAALTFAREGAAVVVADRREEKGRLVVTKIENLGAKGLFIQTDVTKRAEIEAMVDLTVARFGKLDCAVNNAGIAGSLMVPVAEIEEEAWDQLMNVNLKAVWMCMKYEIRAMLKQCKGSIVNISSIYGLKPSDLGHAPQASSASSGCRRPERLTMASKAFGSTWWPRVIRTLRWSIHSSRLHQTSSGRSSVSTAQ